VRDAEDGLGVHPARHVVATLLEDVLHPAVEPHFLGVFRAHDLPRIAKADPTVGMLDLVAVDELLLEEAKLVVDAVAERRIVEGRQRIEETGGEPPEAAVAQAHVELRLADFFQALAERAERGFRRLHQAGGEQVVAEEPAHEVFEREIVEAARIQPRMLGLRGNHPLVDGISDGQRRGHPPIVRGRTPGMPGEGRGEVTEDQRAQHGLGGVPGRTVGGWLGGGFFGRHGDDATKIRATRGWRSR